MSSSTATCLWALASIFTSLALAAEPPLTPAKVTGLELEASLAKKPDIYLKLDLAHRQLEIKARGMVLDQVPVQAIEGAARQAFFLRPRPLPVRVPSLWRVATGPGDTDREVIAPTSLRPARRPNEEELEPTPTPTPRTGQPTPTPTPQIPSRYRVELEGDLLLWITDQPPARTLLARFWAAVREGWAFLVHRQEPPREPPGLLLVMATEDARRLHHLFRQGITLLVVAEGS